MHTNIFVKLIQIPYGVAVRRIMCLLLSCLCAACKRHSLVWSHDPLISCIIQCVMMCTNQQWCLSIALYPGLLTPAFVTCSTNMGEGLVKLSHVVWHTWTCGECHIPTKTASKRVCYWLQTRTVEQLSAQHQTVLVTFLGFRKLLTTVQKECATPPHVQVRHTWLSFTRPSPALVLQAKNAGARRPGYKASTASAGALKEQWIGNYASNDC